MAKNTHSEYVILYEYKLSITVKHNILILVMQCYMFRFKEQLQGITLQITKNLVYKCNTQYWLVRSHKFTNI